MEQIISSLLELYKTNPQTFIFLEYSILFLSQQAFSNYNKYKLIKNNKIQNCKVIHEAPNIKEITQRRNSISEREKTEDNIKNFVNVISEHISKEDMEAINQTNKTKTLAKIKRAPNNHINGFIDIITIIAVLTFTITISAVIEKLILQAR